MSAPAQSPFPSQSFPRLAQLESGHWWFRARNALILWSLRRWTPRWESFLEVGCGTGFVLEAVRREFPKAHLSGAEFFEEGLVFAQQRVPGAQFRRLDATRMQDREAYDVIGAFDVLEHIEGDRLALSNLAAALKPGGTLVVTVPQHRWLFSAADTKAHHVRRYQRSELEGKVKAAGLRVVYASSFVTLLLPLMWLSRRSRDGENYDEWAEFTLPPWQNALLGAVMGVERRLLQWGVRFPLGGSLLMVARKSGPT